MHKPWHLLVYIAADNSLYDDALISLRQITDASLTSSVRITVQFDGPTAHNCVTYSCAHGQRSLTWAAPLDYSNDRAFRLRDFLTRCTLRDTANERVFLVLWGHGAGLDHVYLYNDASTLPAEGSEETSSEHSHPAPHVEGGEGRPETVEVSGSIPFDLLNPDNAHANRYLKDIQLAQILRDFSGLRGGRKIDLLGFDACLMGLAEICNEVSDSVALIAASDEELPKGSWPYDTILQDLTHFPGMDACTLSAVIVSRFLERYAREGKRTRISLSAYNLSACKELVRTVKGLVDEVQARMEDPEVRVRFLLARNFSRTPEVTDYIDLGVFCGEIGRSFPSESALSHRAAEILKVLVEEPYIFYHRDAAEVGAVVPKGLAVYFPQVLPPRAVDVDNAVRAGRGFRTYSPLREGAGARSSQAVGAYRPVGATPLTVPDNKTKGLLLTNGKTPPDVKTKTPPDHRTKGVVRGHAVSREIIGSEILWDQYVALRFNQETGWAKLVKELIPTAQAILKESGSDIPSHERHGDAHS